MGTSLVPVYGLSHLSFNEALTVFKSETVSRIQKLSPFKIRMGVYAEWYVSSHKVMCFESKTLVVKCFSEA